MVTRKLVVTCTITIEWLMTQQASRVAGRGACHCIRKHNCVGALIARQGSSKVCKLWWCECCGWVLRLIETSSCSWVWRISEPTRPDPPQARPLPQPPPHAPIAETPTNRSHATPSGRRLVWTCSSFHICCN